MNEQTRVDVLGVPIDITTMSDLVQTALHWTELPKLHIAVGINAHVCNLVASSSMFRRQIESTDLNYPDGQSVVWAGRALGHPIPERIATTDLIHPLAAACAHHDKKLFLFGGAPGVAERAGRKLTDENPNLRLEISDGFVSEEEMPSLIERINSSGAHILLVGLGDPLQQRWIGDHRDELQVPVIFTCGGLFDWISGENRRAPTWMISAGLEWLWRLLIEPRRLAGRYIVGNTKFIARFVKEFLAHKRFRG